MSVLNDAEGREWSARQKYVPSDSLDARMSRAMLRAAERARRRGDLVKEAQQLLAAELTLTLRSK